MTVYIWMIRTCVERDWHVRGEGDLLTSRWRLRREVVKGVWMCSSEVCSYQSKGTQLRSK